MGSGTSASFYYYDDRGNQTLRDAPGTGSDRTIRYTADGKAHEIQLGNGQTTRFWYGPDGQRYKRTDGTTTTLQYDQGAVGYLSFAGDMDVAIAIRTAVIKDQTLYVQAAAGVVADSVPEMEWRETEHKARALLRASELVEEGLE